MNKKVTNRPNNTIMITQWIVAVLAIIWLIGWLSDFIDDQNYDWYLALLTIIVVASLVLIIEIKSRLRFLWVLMFVLATPLLVLMLALRNFTIQY